MAWTRVLGEVLPDFSVSVRTETQSNAGVLYLLQDGHSSSRCVVPQFALSRDSEIGKDSHEVGRARTNRSGNTPKVIPQIPHISQRMRLRKFQHNPMIGVIVQCEQKGFDLADVVDHMVTGDHISVGALCGDRRPLSENRSCTDPDLFGALPEKIEHLRLLVDTSDLNCRRDEGKRCEATSAAHIQNRALRRYRRGSNAMRR